MEVHHTKHHAAYVKNLNEALTEVDMAGEVNIDDLIAKLDEIPEVVRARVRNNGGGHYNHSLFWESMVKAEDRGEVSGKFATWLAQNGGMEEFKKQFAAEAMGIFGSGWAWFVRLANGEFGFMRTANQDCPLMLPGAPRPVLGLDVWEHAYYLKHQNRRSEYIEAWWNVVNWRKVSRRFESVIEG